MTDLEIQIAWMERNFVPDKDANAKFAPKYVKKNAKRKNSNHPDGWKLPVPDEEVDLHGLTVDEAIAEIDIRLDAMKSVGYRCLRVVHGGGNPGYGPIKKTLDRQFRGPWKHRVRQILVEPGNSGSSLVVI
jgi:DNA-nicking Smr family endonuclease